MKRFTAAFGAVLVLAMLCAPRAARSGEAADQEYFRSFSEKSLAAVQAYRQADLGFVTLACGGDAAQIAVLTAFETLPLVSALALFGAGDHWDSVRSQRDVPDHQLYLPPVALGSVLGTVATAITETVANGVNLVVDRHPKVDYRWTRSVFGTTYLATQANFLDSYNDENSLCRKAFARAQVSSFAYELRLAEIAKASVDDINGVKLVVAGEVARGSTPNLPDAHGVW